MEMDSVQRWVHRLLIGSAVAIFALLILVAAGYIFHWPWTGVIPYEATPAKKDTHFMAGKTVWDWVQLLILPVVLAVGGYCYNSMQRNLEMEIADADRQDEALRAYIIKMSDLLLEGQLCDPTTEKGIIAQKVARALTVTVTRRLDGKRKARLLLFLCEAHLISRTAPIIHLSDAELSGVDLSADHCHCGINLSGVDLSGAVLAKAILRNVDLSRTALALATLTGADLAGTNLTGADLTGATVTDEQLQEAILDHATMPDGRTFAGWQDGQGEPISYVADGGDCMRCHIHRSVGQQGVSTAGSLAG